MDYVAKPTLMGLAGASPQEDAQALRAAMKGLGTDEQAIIDILCHRSNTQRQQIATAFKQEFGRDLLKDLKSELGGRCEKVILGLMLPLGEYLATELNAAMKGVGTNEDVLVEILCTRTNSEIKEVTDAFLAKYGKTVEHEVNKETGGDFKRLLVMLVSRVREERLVNPALAKEMADQLYQAGEGKLGTDEETFYGILAHQSYQQIRLVLEEYKKVSGKTLEEVIKNEISGDLANALLAVVKSIQYRPVYFAEKLRKAMAGAGTDDNALIRIIISRAEIDLGNIEEEFERMNGKTLESAIRGETSGDYQNALVALLGAR